MMDFKFDGKSTKVQQLAEYLQDAIATNEWKVGEKIPSINHLSRQFSVSRDTVFKAFSDLRARGVIDAIHGKNYYVASHTRNILLLLDEYYPFKEVLHTTLVSGLPNSYKIDLWFHQYLSVRLSRTFGRWRQNLAGSCSSAAHRPRNQLQSHG